MYWVEIRKKKTLYNGDMLTYNRYKDEGIVTCLGEFKTVKDARESAVQYLKKHKMYYGGQTGYSYATTVYKYEQPIGNVTLLTTHAQWKGIESGKFFKILSDGTLAGY